MITYDVSERSLNFNNIYFLKLRERYKKKSLGDRNRVINQQNLMLIRIKNKSYIFL